MSSILRRMTKRVLKKAGFTRNKAGAIEDGQGRFVGFHWPRLNWPQFAPFRKGKKQRPKARWNGKRWVRQTPTRRPTFKVPAHPMRSTRADRAEAHKAKMQRKGRA